MDELHYVIVDAQDGYASLKLFASKEAKDRFLELNEDRHDSDYVMDDGPILPHTALTLEQVEERFKEK